MADYSIALCAGEASGDLHGANLVNAMKKYHSSIDFWGCGGKKMMSAGVDLYVDLTCGGTIGVVSTIKTLPVMFAAYKKFKTALIKRHPDLFIPIDFGAFNTRIAKRAVENGIDVVYYIPPSSWRKDPRNGDILIACGGKIITPFPWSAEKLRAQGVDARFFGHPLIDIAKPQTDKKDFLAEIGFDSKVPIVGILAGSRKHEISAHLLFFLEIAYKMHNLSPLQIIIAAAHDSDPIKKKVDKFFIGKDNIPRFFVIENRTYDSIAASDFLLTCSGTATLEAAIIGTPMVIVYKGTSLMWLEYQLRKRVLESYIGLPNIVAAKKICSEFIGEKATVDAVYDEALKLFQDKNYSDNMRNELKVVKSMLGEDGVLDRVAKAVFDMAANISIK